MMNTGYVITDASGQRIFGSPFGSLDLALETASHLRYDREAVQVRTRGLVVAEITDAGVRRASEAL